MVFILCGAAGLRIGEALGLEIGKHISEDFLTFSIAQKVRHCKVEDRLETASAARKVQSSSLDRRPFEGVCREAQERVPFLTGMESRWAHRAFSVAIFIRHSNRPDSSTHIPATTKLATTHSGDFETHIFGIVRMS